MRAVFSQQSSLSWRYLSWIASISALWISAFYRPSRRWKSFQRTAGPWSTPSCSSLPNPLCQILTLNAAQPWMCSALTPCTAWFTYHKDVTSKQNYGCKQGLAVSTARIKVKLLQSLSCSDFPQHRGFLLNSTKLWIAFSTCFFPF